MNKKYLFGIIPLVFLGVAAPVCLLTTTSCSVSKISDQFEINKDYQIDTEFAAIPDNRQYDLIQLFQQRYKSLSNIKFVFTEDLKNFFYIFVGQLFNSESPDWRYHASYEWDIQTGDFNFESRLYVSKYNDGTPLPPDFSYFHDEITHYHASYLSFSKLLQVEDYLTVNFFCEPKFNRGAKRVDCWVNTAGEKKDETVSNDAFSLMSTYFGHFAGKEDLKDVSNVSLPDFSHITITNRLSDQPLTLAEFVEAWRNASMADKINCIDGLQNIKLLSDPYAEPYQFLNVALFSPKEDDQTVGLTIYAPLYYSFVDNYNQESARVHYINYI